MSGPVDFHGSTASGVSSRLVLGIAIALLALTLAIAKPWGAEPTPTPTATPGVSAGIASAAAMAVTTPSAPDRVTPAQTLAVRVSTPDQPGAAITADARWTGVRWFPLDAASPLATFTSVTAWRGGAIALAADPGRPSPGVWTSTDGRAWTRVPEGEAGTFWPGTTVRAVVPVGDRVVALVGVPSGSCAAAPCGTAASQVLTAWVSSDGRHWQPPGGPAFDSLPDIRTADVQAAGNARGAVLAVTAPAVAEQRPRTEVLVSLDGATWRRLPVGALPSGLSVTAAAASADAVFLAGSVDDGVRSTPLILRSTDLDGWASGELPPAPGRPDPQTVWSIRVGPDGLLAMAAASDTAGTELWWRSRDGIYWTSAAGYPPLGATRCTDRSPTCGVAPDGFVLADGRRLVAVRLGGVDSAAAAWTSSGDGAWRLIGSDDFGPVTQPSSTVLLPDGVIVVTPEGAWYGAATTVGGG